MEPTTIRPRTVAQLSLAALALLALAGCSAAPAATVPATSSPASACGAPFPCGELPESFSVTGPGGWTDTVATGAHHWLAPEVATDPTKERWADIAVYRPTLAFDPMTGAPGAVPADLPAWFRQSPLLRVVDEGPVMVDGVASTQLDVEYTEQAVNTLANGYLSFTSVAQTNGTPMYERWVLIPLDGSWVVVQASTLRGLRGLTAETEPGDHLTEVLESIDLP
jgi:hypothetical protein